MLSPDAVASDGAIGDGSPPDAGVFEPPAGPCIAVGSWCLAVPYPSLGRDGVADLLAVAPNDLWMASRNYTLVHYDGTGYQMEPPVSALPYHRLAVGLDGTLWATGANGEVVHRTAGHWDAIPSMAGIEPVIAAVSSTDVWGIVFPGPVINASTVQHFDGTSWVQANPVQSTDFRFRGVAAGSTSNVWVAGHDTTVGLLRVWQWTGTGWVDHSPPSGDQIFLEAVRLFVRATNDVWVVGNGTHQVVHWDGTTWSASMPPVPTVTDTWLDPTGDLWVVGGPVVARLHAGVWSEMFRLPADSFAGISAITGTSGSDVWIAFSEGRGGNLMHFDGTQWTQLVTSPVVDNAGKRVDEFATGVAIGDSVWLAPTFGVVRVQHGRYAYTDVSGADTVYIGVAMLARSPTDIWMAGQDYDGFAINHYDGISWIPEQVGHVYLNSLADANGTMLAAGSVVTVPTSAHIWKRDATGWVVTSGLAGANDLWEDGMGGVLAVGNPFYRWSGAMWEPTSISSPPGGLVDVDGPNLAHLWGIGPGGLYHHDNGSFVLEAPAAANERFLSVLVVGDDAWVVAALDETANPRTVILHRAATGSLDREVLPANGNKLIAVGNTLWLVGGFLATRPL